MSYGPARFASGWWEVPRDTVRMLKKIGLPSARPASDPGPGESADLDPRWWPWPWPVTLALALPAGAGLVSARRRRARRPGRSDAA